MPSIIERLRYVVLGTRDLDAAAGYATAELGLQLVDHGADTIALRSDERQYTLVYQKMDPAVQSIGLEVADVRVLDTAANALAARGIVLEADNVLAARRNVRALGRFRTPGGVQVELVVRPQDQGWRFFATRDSGMLGLAGVALRSTDAAADEAVWGEVFGLRVNDWIGDAAYLGLADGAHHRLSVHPAATPGVLAVEYEVETLDHVMQQAYRISDGGSEPLHGPGRRPVSGQAFVTFAGPGDTHYSFVHAGDAIDLQVPRRPRQFAPGPASHCNWGSRCRIAELDGSIVVPARPRLAGVRSA